MSTTTLTSRMFSKNVAGAKKAANRGPVIILHRGRPAYVLLSIQEYQRLTAGQKSLSEALAQTDSGDFEFVPPRLHGGFFKLPDYS